MPAFDAGTLLPAALRRWVMDEAERMPCPPEFIAAAALVALGSIIGARCAIKPKARDSWLIVPNLWGGIVGDPSAKKSPAWGAALKPLDRLIAKALEEHRAALADYETAKVVFDAGARRAGRRLHAARRAPQSMAQPDRRRGDPGRARLAGGRGLAAGRSERRHRAGKRQAHRALPDQPRRESQAQGGRRMNWLERARREIGGTSPGTTANSADGNPIAVMAVLYDAAPAKHDASNGSNGSAPPWQWLDSEALREAFEERAAIMEFDGGMSREDAERAAWALVL
ncbi:DUF3987 domain-containing protein [Caldichromatium japonicum]|uniref:DUF3987 domain-containing protein n=1 Tax=Caldichromatium japonicum TaxID=2699430 RepID=UPI001B354A59|nr:DUF3987 domain-containing protein [Caldichromatium japonicum]